MSFFGSRFKILYNNFCVIGETAKDYSILISYIWLWRLLIFYAPLKEFEWGSTSNISTIVLQESEQIIQTYHIFGTKRKLNTYSLHQLTPGSCHFLEYVDPQSHIWRHTKPKSKSTELENCTTFVSIVVCTYTKLWKWITIENLKITIRWSSIQQSRNA